MTGTVAELQNLLKPDSMAKEISHLWDKHNQGMQTYKDELEDLYKYIFATEANDQIQDNWMNNTTLPALTNIRDLLHSNYSSALFPNDDWLKWEAYTQEPGHKRKRRVIEGYMKSKTRESAFRTEMSKLLWDYIDGNCFAMNEFVNESKIDPATGEKITGYIGPKTRRISPYDIVFNPTAPDFFSAWKIVRSWKTLGEIERLAQETGDEHLKTILRDRELLRNKFGCIRAEDRQKANMYQIDGFDSLYEYYGQDCVEFLEFWGDIRDTNTGEFKTDQVITIIDRCKVVRQKTWDSWLTHAPIYHVGWRKRPDNLYGMGPLVNLVGIQYRIDHLQNAYSDAIDKGLIPPLVIEGVVDEMPDNMDEPGAVIHMQEGGRITELGKNLSAIIAAKREIPELIAYMHEFAGAPKEAAGVRTPGEKTAFEVDKLFTAAGRTFQEKITQFEIEFLEPVLNGMLELARRDNNVTETIRVFSDAAQATIFQSVTKEDLVSKGILRPIGARHFATVANTVGDLSRVASTALWAKIERHIPSFELAEMVIGNLVPDRFAMIKRDVVAEDNADLQRAMSLAEQQVAAEEAIDLEGGGFPDVV